MNEVKISGKLCQKKEAFTQNGKCITSFGLSFYNGKKDGNTVYDFLDCKYFGKLNIKDKEIVDIVGWLAVESWQKDGKKYSKTVVYCKDVKLYTSDNKTSEQVENLPFDDEMPF